MNAFLYLILTTASLFFSYLPLAAQSDTAYKPFPKDTAVWGYENTWGDGTYWTREERYYFRMGDTLHNGLIYGKIYYQTVYSQNIPPVNELTNTYHQPIALLREENKRIYFVSLLPFGKPDNLEENLLYDFNIRQGDSITGVTTYNRFLDCYVGDSFLRKDTVCIRKAKIRTSKQKKFEVYDKDIYHITFISPREHDTIIGYHNWIEGVGGNNDLFIPFYWDQIFEEPQSRLKCFWSKTSEVNYPSQLVGLGKCSRHNFVSRKNTNIRNITANILVSTENQINYKIENLTLSPLNLTVYDMLGKLILNQTISGQRFFDLDLSNRVSGLFYLYFFRDNVYQFSTKILLLK